MAKKEKQKRQEGDEKKGKKNREKETKESSKHKKKRKKKKDIRSLFKKMVIGFGIFLLVIAAAAVGLYFYTPLGKYARPIFKVVPYPVAILGDSWQLISSRELIFNADAVRRFYESQDFSLKKMRVDFTTEQGKIRLKIKEKGVLDKLIENKIVEEIAKDRGIVVTTAEARTAIESKITRSGDENSLKLSLKSLYGWSIADFRKNVVVPQLCLRKLFSAYVAEIDQQEGYKKCTLAKNELREDGSNFVDVVKKYSEGESAQNDGELGWFRYHQLIPEVADIAFSLKEGEISDVVVSTVGFHIVQIQEVRQMEIEDNELEESGSEKKSQAIREVKIRQVYVHGETFLNWVVQQKKQASVIILMKDYKWDAEKGKVVFRDESMQKVEKKILQISQGDPSMRGVQ